jgi:uncharacterized membrane protein YhhN
MAGTHLFGFICSVLAFLIVGTVGDAILGWPPTAFTVAGVVAFLVVRQVFVFWGGNPSPRKQ